MRELRRRRDAEDQAAEQAEAEREGEPDAVDARSAILIGNDAIIGTARSASVAHTAIAAPSGGAEHRQQQVLGQQQADDAPRAGAERQPDADLAVAGAGARQHQVRGVAADREQQEQQHALQHRQRADEELLRPARRLPEAQHRAWMALFVSG